MPTPLDTLVVMTKILEEEWVYRLRKGNFIYLVKEKQFGQVRWEFEPPEPGHCAGRLGIQRCTKYGEGWGYTTHEEWFVKSNGYGFDGNPIIMPIEGHLSDNPKPLNEPIIRRMQREINSLDRRIERLERRIIQQTFIYPEVSDN